MIDCRKKIVAFTLVETILSSVIALIIVFATTSFFFDIVQGKKQYLIRQELQYSLDFALTALTETIQQASAVNTIDSVFDIHPGTLRLSTADLETNPTLISSDGVEFTLKKGSADSLSLIPSRVQVSSLTFHYSEPNNSTGNVTGTLTLQSRIDPSAFLTETFSVSLRSHLP